MVTLTIIRYPKKFIPVALAAMAIHRVPLFFKKGISFFKLMGCGKNGSFDKNPDWQQWAIFTVQQSAYTTNGKDILNNLYGGFIKKWLTLFQCETFTILLDPIEMHGTWDGKNIFEKIPIIPAHEGMIAVLTRATIRFNRIKEFWDNVPAVSQKTRNANGLLFSTGIGELPLIKQATFSIWRNMDDMKEFAYRMKEHSDVIKKTRERDWYKEELFARFKVIKVFGTIKGINPVEGKM